MAFFSKIFKKSEKRQPEPQIEEFTEIPLDLEEKTDHIKIVPEKLSDFTDTDRIIRKARSGSVVIVNIKEMRDKSMEELKHAISKFKTSVAVFNGDIAGAGESEFIILTPSTVKIHRGEE